MRIQQGFASFLLYGLAFILVLEWIWPLQALTDTANIWVFIVFLAVSFLVTYLGVSLLWSLMIKGFAIIFLLHGLYFEGSFLQLNWMVPFFQKIQGDMALVFSSNVHGVSNLFRSLLFFILLWLMTYLLHYWLIQRRKLLLFFFVTISYIAVLDTFTPYDAAASIIRTVVTGFICLSILAFYRLKEAEDVNKEKEGIPLRKWLLPFSIMLGLSVFLGFILPKQAPLWPDPVPFIQAFAKQTEENENAAVKRVGYGTDDSRLGGPFIGDSTVVFRTEVESSHYWKVETKDVYTGKGWVQSVENVEARSFSQNSPVPVSSFAPGNTLEKKLETSYVYQVEDYPHLIYPHGVKRIEAEYHAEFEADPAIEKIYSVDDGQSVILPSYSVVLEKAIYRGDDLTSAIGDAGINRDFMNRYTQLPDSMPGRVGDLAKEITAGKDNWYDKAKAIEQYLKSSDFSYDTKDVLIPGKNDDYVDQFLFESKRGYCDNFSTSMTAMLRTLDIPARWVKGYTAGEYNGSNGQWRQYEITNDHAHSWVEVYFPNAGWVTFEPTPGFTNHTQYQADESAASISENTGADPLQEQPEQHQEDRQPEEEERDVVSGTAESDWHNVKGTAESFWKWSAIALAAVGILGFLLFRTRIKWQPLLYIWRFKRMNDSAVFPEAYLLLLKQLQRFGIKRENGQTLREYAWTVDQHFSTNEMTRLTERYEQYLYRNKLEENHWDEMRELWEYLIKRTMA